MDTVATDTQTVDAPALAAAMAAARSPQEVERLERLDQAWHQSGGSVVATARRLDATYTQTLRALASPQVGHLPPDDPRVFAHAMAMSNATDGVARPGKTPKDEVQIATEKAAMAHLAGNSTHELAHRNLTSVAEAEIARDARLIQRSRMAGNRTSDIGKSDIGKADTSKVESSEGQAPTPIKRGPQETR
jgi:hypothetical protein